MCKEIVGRSVRKHKLHYVGMLSDGDSKSYDAVCQARVYGSEKLIETQTHKFFFKGQLKYKTKTPKQTHLWHYNAKQYFSISSGMLFGQNIAFFLTT